MMFAAIVRRRVTMVGFLASAMLAYGQPAGATPFRLDYLVSDVGGGEYRYDFVLTLDNNDSSWVASQGFASFIIGDCTPSCPTALTDFDGIAVDPPWTSFLNISGTHNGPALYPTGTYYTPASVGETKTFSGTSTAHLTQGNLLWSNLQGQNGGTLANSVVANRLAPDCGNGTIDAGEDCDDSNIINGDCCGADCQFEETTDSCEDGDVCTVGDLCDGAGNCVAGTVDECDDGDRCSVDSCVPMTGCVHDDQPATGCLTAAKSSLQLKYSLDHFKDKLKWKFSDGQAVTQAELGNPSSDRGYALCIYDQEGSVSSRVASINVGPSALWVNKDPKGFQFKNKTGLVNGVAKVSLKPGADGESSASLMAKGIHVPMPEPVQPALYFHKDTKVIVQLINDQTSKCWTTEFSTASKNERGSFKAKTP